MYSFRLCALVSAVVAAFSLPLASSAQAPQLINYQGRLLNGTNLVNGSVGLSLRLFDASTGGTKLYEDSNTVTVVDGLYSTFIGDDPASISLLAALTNSAVFVETAVNGMTLAPRERLVSAGYSLSTRGIYISPYSDTVVFDPAENYVASNAYHSTSAGGYNNLIHLNAHSAFLGGGGWNRILIGANSCVLGGGLRNTIGAGAVESHLGGGSDNNVQDNAARAVLCGGAANSIETNADAAFLGGGQSNSIKAYASYSVLGGGLDNAVGTGAFYSVIGGGAVNRIQSYANDSFIGGGALNVIQDYAGASVLGGGVNNEIRRGSYSSVLGGGESNGIHASAYESFLGGGHNNRIFTNSWGACLGGGSQNSIQTNSPASFLGGGYGNAVRSYASYSVLNGGSANRIEQGAAYGFLGSGQLNRIETNATFAFLGGGNANRVTGPCGVVPGGVENIAAAYSFAAGRGAEATFEGSFVWADASAWSAFSATASNQFLIRANGGVGINNNNPAYDLDVTGRIRSRESADGTAGVLFYQSGPAANRGFVGMDGDGYVGFYGFSGAGWGFVMNVTNGNAGIGTTRPATQLHLKQSTDNSGFNPANDGFRIEAASGESWTLQTQAAGDLVFDSGLGSGYAYISKNQGTFNITSDARFKKNIQPLGDTLERVLQLQPVTFQYKAAPDESRPVVGFVAQDVEPLFPDLVDVKDGFMAINYGGFGPVAIRAIQEMDAQVGHLKAENAELKQQLEALARRQQQLESSLQAVLQAR